MKKDRNTSCKNCIFALWEEITQQGCAFDLINKFNNSGKQILECYDEEKEFYVIKDHTCMYKRPNNWIYAQHSLEDQEAQIKKEIQIRFQAIVIADDKDGLEVIKSTVESLFGQTLKPIHIAVVRTKHNIVRPIEIIEFLKDRGIRWKIENIVDETIPVYKYEDLVVDFVKDSHMYSVFKAGTKVPNNFFIDINDKIHNNALSFAALMPNSQGSGWTIPRSVYSYFMGNKQLSLLTKIEGFEWPTLPVTQVVTNFPQ